MLICHNCGVEIDENLDHCPLCRAPLRGEASELELGLPPPTGGPSEDVARPVARLRIWEIVSLFAGAAAAVVLVADFANGLTVTWARYPILSVFYLWTVCSVLILLRRYRLFLLLAEAGASAVFLLGLDLLAPGEPWFLSLALPLTILAGAILGAVWAAALALRPRVLAILAVVLGAAGTFALGLEGVLNVHLSEGFRLSWSLVVFGCIVPMVGLLFYVQYRLKVTHSDLRKIFHV
jgi:hypothetical protein